MRRNIVKFSKCIFAVELVAMLRGLSLLFGFACALQCQAFAAEIEVKEPSALVATLLAAKAGDKLILPPGIYGELNLDGAKDGRLVFPNPVSIVGLDKSNPPAFKKISLRSVSNLVFSGIAVRHPWHEGDPLELRAFSIDKSSNVTLEDSVLQGDVISGGGNEVDGFASGSAIGVADSDHIKIVGNKIFTWHRGGIFGVTNDLEVSNNELYDLSSDGLDFAEITNAVIAHNHVHDLSRSAESKAHPDMIQFWTTSTHKPSENIEIKDNFLDQGNGAWSQSIFIRNELVDTSQAGLEMYYRNFRITGNVIRNAHIHGITVGEIDGLDISHNTLLQTIGSKLGGNVSVPMINVSKSAKRVNVTYNIFPRTSVTLLKPLPGWVIGFNVVAQRDLPGRPDYYSQVFLNALAKGKLSLADLQLLPDSAAAKGGQGAELNKFQTRPRSNMFYFTNDRDSVSGDIEKFDAKHVFGPSGPINAEDAKVEWDFGDGSIGQGVAARHSYAELGDYEVKAKMTLGTGQTLLANRTIHVGVN